MATLYPAETTSGVVTSYIPLTDEFIPPHSCTTIFRQNGKSNSRSYIAYDPLYGVNIDSNVICQPAAVTTWWTHATLGTSMSFDTSMSIGPLSCPSSWNTVAESVKDVSSTAAMCCPPGYYLAHSVEGKVLGDCLSTVTSGFSGVFAYTGDGSVWTVTTATVTAQQSTVGAIAVIGWNIRQTPATTSTSSTLSSTTSLSQTPTPTSSSTTSPSTSTSGSASGLATGAAVGIGVGVGLGVTGLACLLASVVLIRRRRRRRERDTNREPSLTSVPVEGRPAVGVSHGNMSQPSPSEVGNDGAIRGLELHSEHRQQRSAVPAELRG